jgi:8-oxo-dGTP diphosphatase
MNSDLYGKIIGKVPPHILKQMSDKLNKSNSDSKGYEQCTNILTNPELSYSLAKLMKNFFDHYSAIKDSRDEYELRGGDGMRRWLEQALNKSRGEVKLRKTNRSTVFNNQFIKQHDKSFDKPTDTKKLMEEDLTKYKYTDASIGVLFNNKGEILLLRRSDTDSWMPLKYSFVGGKVENGEKISDGLIRETKEETNLNVTKFIFCFKRKENDLTLNFFICYCNNPNDVQLSDEHDDYVWCNMDYMDNLELVPLVKEDIKKCLDTINTNKSI